MKILFLIYSLGGGGAERVTITLANHMVSQGHDVAVAVLDNTHRSPYVPDQRVRIIGLDLAAESGSVYTALQNLRHRLRTVKALLRTEKPDLAVGMMTTSAVLLGLTRKSGSIKTVGSERVYPPAVPMSRTQHLLRKYSYGRLDHLVVQTSDVAHWAIKNTNARDVRVIPNPVERLPELVTSPAPADLLEDDAKLVLAVGRLVEQKRFDHLIDAFASARGTDCRWHLAILGEGPLRASLELQIKRRGLGEYVLLTGHVDNPREWLERADLFVMSSLFEGMPNAMMEAMAHGLPVVSYDFMTGPRDLIDHGRTGLLVEDGNASALAEAIRSLMADPVARHSMGAAAADILDRCAPAEIVEKWLALAVGSDGLGR